MEMEHINENTIRVLIGHEDLEERQKSCFSSVFVRFPPSPNGIQVAVKRRFGQI